MDERRISGTGWQRFRTYREDRGINELPNGHDLLLVLRERLATEAGTRLLSRFLTGPSKVLALIMRRLFRFWIPWLGGLLRLGDLIGQFRDRTLQQFQTIRLVDDYFVQLIVIVLQMHQRQFEFL